MLRAVFTESETCQKTLTSKVSDNRDRRDKTKLAAVRDSAQYS